MSERTALRSTALQRGSMNQISPHSWRWQKYCERAFARRESSLHRGTVRLLQVRCNPIRHLGVLSTAEKAAKKNYTHSINPNTYCSFPIVGNFDPASFPAITRQNEKEIIIGDVPRKGDPGGKKLIFAYRGKNYFQAVKTSGRLLYLRVCNEQVPFYCWRMNYRPVDRFTVALCIYVKLDGDGLSRVCLRFWSGLLRRENSQGRRFSLRFERGWLCCVLFPEEMELLCQRLFFFFFCNARGFC